MYLKMVPLNILCIFIFLYYVSYLKKVLLFYRLVNDKKFET